MSDATQTDVSRPSALPTASLLNSRRIASGQQGAEGKALTSDEYLAHVEKGMNERVDAEVEVLVEGMVDLVGLASMEGKDKFKVAEESFQARARTESMVKAAHSLLSIIHSLKLQLLLSDESQIAQRRDAEAKVVREERDKAKKEVEELLDELLKRRNGT